MASERIPSQDLQDLLNDDIFVDFFNTFLNLPVFGQTPFFDPVLQRWELWPVLPFHPGSRSNGLIKWLQEHRLGLFHRTDLYLHYLLCQKLLRNWREKRCSSKNLDEALKEDKDKFSDHCLFHRCIGSVRGILRFRAFLHGSIGEELISFWLIVEKILSLDVRNISEQDLYYSLIRILRVNHLSSGSAVLETCSINVESVLQGQSWQPPGIRCDVLRQMQDTALMKLHQYWVPAFLSHCLKRLHEGHNLHDHSQHKITRNEPPSPQSSSQLQDETIIYCSKLSKQKLWHQLTAGIEETFSKSPRENRVGQSHPEFKSKVLEQSNLISNTTSAHQDKKNMNSLYPQFDFPFTLHSAYETPIIEPLTQLPMETVERVNVSDDWLHWVLRGEEHAGRPFHSFLVERGHVDAALLVILWQDLADILNALLKDRSVELCHVLSDRFFHHYILGTKENSSIGCDRLPSITCRHLHPHTVTQLRELLPFREAAACVLEAQCQICKGLSPLYDQFLDEEDKIFLQYVADNATDDMQSQPATSESPENTRARAAHRQQATMMLAQACAHGGEVEGQDKMLASLLAEDLPCGSSIQPLGYPSPVHREDYSKMSFDELAWRNPKLAIEMLSKNFWSNRHSISTENPQSDISERRYLHRSLINPQRIRKGSVILNKPLTRPRSLYEVLHHPVHLEFFRQYLKMKHSEEPLVFWLMVKKMGNIQNLKQQRFFIKKIVQRFFHSQRRAEHLLQCKAVIIQQIPTMTLVSSSILVSAQTSVYKSMDEKWFKGYQDTFPEAADDSIVLKAPKKRRRQYITNKVKRAWNLLISFVRSLCKFLREMKNPNTRREFETFLKREVYNDSKNLPAVSSQRPPSSPRPSLVNVPQESEILHPRRRFVMNRVVIVNYLINDLSFCMEVIRFLHMCDAATFLLTHGMFGSNDEALLRSKVNIIIKLFVVCDTAPALRVNILDSQRDFIREMAAHGAVDGSLFHSALFTAFPTVIFFWKEFCTMKAMNGFHCKQNRKQQPKPNQSPTDEDPSRTASPSNECKYDFPILRFTLSRGIQLLLPNLPERHKAAQFADHLSPWKRRTPPSGAALTPQSMTLQKTFGRSPSKETVMFADKV
ncbi:regulator of G-protein signaling protein-like [Engystomops pustulosus]|uniref:regulator of G-protein signaling protein-like n=1 Tax=Engystomops pustulosus TaxID=76066 RepID=UPI003AFAA585